MTRAAVPVDPAPRPSDNPPAPGVRPRLMAGLLDALLLTILIAVACLVAAAVLGVAEAPVAALRISGPVIAVGLSLLYFGLRDGRAPGTFGKQQFRLIVQRGDGAAAGALRLVWRGLVKLTLALAGVIGLLAPLFGHWLAGPLVLAWIALLPVGTDGRAIQDRLSFTRVVRSS